MSNSRLWLCVAIAINCAFNAFCDKSAAVQVIKHGAASKSPLKHEARSDTSIQKENDAISTKGFTRGQLKQRAFLWEGIFGSCALLILVLAVIANVYKTGKAEVPVVTFNGCALPSVDSYDLLPSIKRCCNRCKSKGAKTGHLYEGLASSEDPLGEESSDLESAERLGQELAPRRATKEKTDSEIEEEKKAARDAWEAKQALQETANRKFKRIRFTLLLLLLVLYVSVCCIVPQWKAQGASCTAGFFWEDHVPFMASFLITKLVELALYLFDPTIEGVLPLWKFLLLFIPSFLGYCDGYQDATSIVIAMQCSLDQTAEVNHSLAGTLSTTMSWSFWIGVFLMQWVCFCILGIVGYLWDFDPSLAVLAKLVHMDALTMCLSVPSTWVLTAVNAVRSFGEDIPQAGQQTLYVLYVKQNVFMIVSIACSVACSLKALQDTFKRAALAMGLEEKMLSAYQQDKPPPSAGPLSDDEAAVRIQKWVRGWIVRSFRGDGAQIPQLRAAARLRSAEEEDEEEEEEEAEDDAEAEAQYEEAIGVDLLQGAADQVEEVQEAAMDDIAASLQEAAEDLLEERQIPEAAEAGGSVSSRAPRSRSKKSKK